MTTLTHEEITEDLSILATLNTDMNLEILKLRSDIQDHRIHSIELNLKLAEVEKELDQERKMKEYLIRLTAKK